MPGVALKETFPTPLHFGYHRSIVVRFQKHLKEPQYNMNRKLPGSYSRPTSTTCDDQPNQSSFIKFRSIHSTKSNFVHSITQHYLFF